MSAAEIAAALGGRPNGSGWIAPCPCHVDDNPSLSISEGNDGKALLKCHAGCRQDALVQWARDNGHDLSGRRRRPARRPVATYDYRDETGALRYQVLRRQPKDFPQRRPDGSGGWIWNMHGVERLPYRLPEMLAAPGKTVFVPEGEKDCDRLAREGLVATTNAGGAGKWRDELCPWFEDRDVVILPDNDEPGRKHVKDVARQLRGVARRIRVLALPDLPEKGDVSDWLNAGHTVKDLRRLAHCAPEWEPREPEAEQDHRDADGLPTIRLQAGNRPEIVIEAIEALEAAGVPLYRRDLKIVDVARIPAKASDGSDITTPSIVPVPGQQLVHELGKAAHWEKYDGRRRDWRPADVPAEIASTIAALPNEWKFRSLAGIIATQTMRPDGTLLTGPGYDPATGYLLLNPPPMPAIPDEPTREDAIRALRRLGRLLSEFPFVDEASRSVALSMLMTPVLRPALPPAAPMHVTNSPVGGTGKSYLADLSSGTAIGERCPVISRSPKPEETEKRLVGAALDGQPIISIDNVNGELRSEFLCQAVERPILLVRALCKSDLIRIANTTTTFCNGNNIQISADLVRRTIQCTLDANMERPETRKFELNPLAEILAHRGRYVAAVLTIARAYVAAGQPMRLTPFASFDRWNELVRGSLLWLGCADPVDTVADLALADPVKNQRAEVFRAIASAMAKEDVGGHRVTEIAAQAKKNDALRDALMLVARDREGNIDATRLGIWLRDSANTIAAGLKLRRNGRDASRVRWQFVPVDGGG